ncbi:MAG: glycosyltransferase [Desulfobacterales bacterium]
MRIDRGPREAFPAGVEPTAESMKTLVLTTKFPHPSETFILNHIEFLAENGIDVQILSRQRPLRLQANDSILRNRRSGRIQYYSDFISQTPGGKWSKASFYANRASRLLVRDPGRFARIGLRSLCHRTKPFRPLHLAEAIGPDHRFDIVHAHYCTNGLIASDMIDAGCISGKLITSVHGYDITKIISSKGPAYYRKLFAMGDRFLTVNRHFKSILEDFGVDPEKIIVHHMGVDTNRFPFSQRYEKAVEGNVRILSVGRLVEKKGFRFAIEAFPEILASTRNVDYTIIGDGPERPALEALIAELGLESHIHLIGWKTHGEVSEHMRNAHVFLAPSVTAGDGDQEGIPVVLMEAMAVGLPVLSTFHSGIPELIAHETSGFLVPERDPAGIASTLTAMLGDPATLRSAAEAARRTVETQFNHRIQNDRLLQIYRDVVSAE